MEDKNAAGPAQNPPGAAVCLEDACYKLYIYILSWIQSLHIVCIEDTCYNLSRDSCKLSGRQLQLSWRQAWETTLKTAVNSPFWEQLQIVFKAGSKNCLEDGCKYFWGQLQATCLVLFCWVFSDTVINASCCFWQKGSQREAGTECACRRSWCIVCLLTNCLSDNLAKYMHRVQASLLEKGSVYTVAVDVLYSKHLCFF